MTTAIFLRRLITLLGGLVVITLAVLEVLAAHTALPRVPWTEDVQRVDSARDCSEHEPDPALPSPEGVPDVVASTRISPSVAVPR
jgi:hypothetical protein